MSAPDRLLAAVAAGALALSGLAPAATHRISRNDPTYARYPRSTCWSGRRATGGTELRFSARTWNAASAARARRGRDGRGSAEHLPANLSGERRLLRPPRRHVHLASGHNHFHFENYATYTLQPVGAGGASQRTSNKTTFCIMDTDKVNGSLPAFPGSRFTPAATRSSRACPSVGRTPTHRGLSGQAIDLTGWTDGDYKLTITGDPKDQLLETDESDNVACSVIRIGIGARPRRR